MPSRSDAAGEPGGEISLARVHQGHSRSGVACVSAAPRGGEPRLDDGPPACRQPGVGGSTGGAHGGGARMVPPRSSGRDEATSAATRSTRRHDATENRGGAAAARTGCEGESTVGSFGDPRRVRNRVNAKASVPIRSAGADIGPPVEQRDADAGAGVRRVGAERCPRSRSPPSRKSQRETRARPRGRRSGG